MIEELPDPHISADDLDDSVDGPKADKVDVDLDQPEAQRLEKQLRITRKDLDRYGYTEGCPKNAATSSMKVG